MAYVRDMRYVYRSCLVFQSRFSVKAVIIQIVTRNDDLELDSRLPGRPKNSVFSCFGFGPLVLCLEV
jgi:hypothetical protein